jgi:hypothetical protein
MNDNDRKQRLIDTIRRKNVLAPPSVSAVEPEVRTMMKFFRLDAAKLAELQSKFVAGVVVTWTYDVSDAGAFVDALRTNETKFITGSANSAARYLGTYVKVASESRPDANFMTLWGCATVGDIATIGAFTGAAQAAFDEFLSFIEQNSFRQDVHSIAAAHQTKGG